MSWGYTAAAHYNTQRSYIPSSSNDSFIIPPFRHNGTMLKRSNEIPFWENSLYARTNILLFRKQCEDFSFCILSIRQGWYNLSWAIFGCDLPMEYPQAGTFLSNWTFYKVGCELIYNYHTTHIHWKGVDLKTVLLVILRYTTEVTERIIA